tara:strand:+ start:255 stop:941 length:687 start_codon:yes stop_codon:yes gene_type:complete
MSFNPNKENIEEWNDRMVKKYHSEGTRFERGFILKRYMEKQALVKMIKFSGNIDDSIILDIGCGEGFLLRMVKKAKKIVGIDMSRTAIKRAKSLSDNIEYHIGDASNMPFEDNSFDIIFSSEVLEHVLEPEKVFKEICRILKPNGRFVFSVPDEQRTLDLIKLVKRLGLIYFIQGVSTPGGQDNEWHLHEASEKWIKNHLNNKFDKIYTEHYPPLFETRVIGFAENKK